ncbi:triose-phosphate isomerase family protein [Gluconobacter oxydans]|uniref:triose-phosphate isomerase family protein n=1 Tax=Gluconobacter oxydans TaxID=442 RepID=UPI001CD84062|nr:triose-phosphate isomerase family protein [Gluconobacter oxydans]
MKKCRPIIAISLKMYMSPEQTRVWMQEVMAILPPDLGSFTDFVVAPSFVSISDVRSICMNTPQGGHLDIGGQDVFWEDSGAYTGEVSAPMLRDSGCRYAEIGHAERRRLFGETDTITAKKFAACARSGLIPILCVGESFRGTAKEAAEACIAQINAARSLSPDDTPFVVAWEPVWAIGAEEPAEVAYIHAVGGALKEALKATSGGRLMYGGSAGPGMFEMICDVVDGLFLGRFAHKPQNVRLVLNDVKRVVQARSTMSNL